MLNMIKFWLMKSWKSLIFPFTDVPSAPLALEISNVTNNSADLAWKPPTNDGGTPLTGYAIEYRLASRTFWTKSQIVGANTLSYTITKLTEESEYYFRIFAINVEGYSKPLQSTDVTKPVRKIGKCLLQL